MLDRRTGKPVFVEQESAVPASTLLGEHVALLAPHSPLRFMLTGLREKDMWDAASFDQLYCRIDSQSVRNQRTYGRPGQAQLPGAIAAADPRTGSASERIGMARFASNSLPSYPSRSPWVWRSWAGNSSRPAGVAFYGCTLDYYLPADTVCMHTMSRPVPTWGRAACLRAARRRPFVTGPVGGKW